MAKENIVMLHGQVQIPPKVYVNKDKELTKAVFAVKVLRRPLYNGQVLANKLYFDCPIIYTKNAIMIEQSSLLAMHDMVDIRGVLTTQEVLKITICGECGHKNSSKGNTVYVTPLYICRREQEITPERGLELLKERSEVSNLLMVIGTLCRDPELYTDERERASIQYQLAVNRKFRIREDAPETKTDYPWVKTHGQQAIKDAESLKTGSVVYISGSLQTRDITRTTVCKNCGAAYTWSDTAMEIVPYSTEYLEGCDLPEPSERPDKENINQEGGDTDAQKGYG